MPSASRVEAAAAAEEEEYCLLVAERRRVQVLRLGAVGHVRHGEERSVQTLEVEEGSNLLGLTEVARGDQRRRDRLP